MPETGDPRHPSSFKPQKTPAPLPHPANLNHGEQMIVKIFASSKRARDGSSSSGSPRILK
jgi:hypothetical protein